LGLAQQVEGIKEGKAGRDDGQVKGRGQSEVGTEGVKGTEGRQGKGEL
jgi:hypothetical protein